MKIELWADVICPFCGLMDHRLHQALDRFEHADEVRLVHRSIQLHPDLPREGVTQRRLIRMAGVPMESAERTLRSIERAARAEGLDRYRALERTLGPTDYAHELLAHAGAKGCGERVWTAMFRAHFGQGRTLWTLDDVADFAADVGLDRDEAVEVLGDRRFRPQVEADQREAERLGAQGAPFLVIDGTHAIAGAVDIQQLLAAMTQAWRASHPVPEPLPVIHTSDDMCGPDGCVVHPRTVG